MALPATDNFNRSNENPLAGNWITAPGASDCKIVSNEAAGTAGSSVAYWNADSFSNDQYSQGVSPVIDNAGFAVRIATGGSQKNFYCADVYNATTLRLWKCVNDTYSQLGGSYTGTILTTDVIRLEANGTTIRVLQNGIERISVTDSAHSSGAAGIWFYNFTNPRLDNWEGGNLGGGGISIPVVMHHLKQQGVS